MGTDQEEIFYQGWDPVPDYNKQQSDQFDIINIRDHQPLN